MLGGRNLACAQREATSGKNLNKELSPEEEARDPSPDAEARQKFWSIMGDYKNRNHVASRTKFHVPKEDFPRPLNCIDVQATIDDCLNIDGDKSLSEPWIGVTRFALLNKNPPREYVCFCHTRC